MSSIRRVLVYFLILLCGPGAFAKNFALLAGGVENQGGTQFKSAFSNLKNFERMKSDWNIDYLYNGDTSDGKKTNLTTQVMSDTIADYRKKILSGEIGKDDQLMIYINTHGSPKRTGEQMTHSISTTDGEYSLDNLNEIAYFAKQKGVKLAIVDQSCYSGNLQQLAGYGTCVISATTKDNVGYVDLGDNMSLELMKAASAKGTSLEDIFLNARKTSFGPALPIISTYAGTKTAQVTAILDKIDYAKIFAEKNQSCYKMLPDLQTKINETQNAMLATMVKDPVVLMKAKSLSAEVLKMKDELLRAQGDFQEVAGRKFLACEKQVLRSEDEKELPWELCLEDADHASVEKKLREKKAEFAKLAVPEEEKPESKLRSGNLRKSSAKGELKGTFVSINPGFEEYVETPDVKWNRLKSDIESLENVQKNSLDKAAAFQAYAKLHGPGMEQAITMKVHNLMAKERELYKTLYEHFQKQEKGSNPCADFKI